MAKKLIRFDVTISSDDDVAVFRQSMQMYNRVTCIPFRSQSLEVTDLDFGDYERYPTQLRSPVKLMADGMRHFPASIQLVTIRVRAHNVKVETGDEEANAEFMTKFNFFVEEFQTYLRREDVTVTFDLKLLKQFLSAWDKKVHDVTCFFKEGAGVVLVTECQGFVTRLMIATAIKDHPPNSPVATGDETLQSTNVTYLYVLSFRSCVHSSYPLVCLPERTASFLATSH